MGCVADFPAIICALSDRGLPQHDDSPQQIFLFLVSSILELEKKKFESIFGDDKGQPVNNFDFFGFFGLQGDVVHNFLALRFHRPQEN